MRKIFLSVLVFIGSFISISAFSRDLPGSYGWRDITFSYPSAWYLETKQLGKNSHYIMLNNGQAGKQKVSIFFSIYEKPQHLLITKDSSPKEQALAKKMINAEFKLMDKVGVSPNLSKNMIAIKYGLANFKNYTGVEIKDSSKLIVGYSTYIISRTLAHGGQILYPDETVDGRFHNVQVFFLHTSKYFIFGALSDTFFRDYEDDQEYSKSIYTAVDVIATVNIGDSGGKKK